MADTKSSATEAAALAGSTKPTKPDESAFQKLLEKAEKEHKDVMARYNAIKAQIELVQPNKNKEGGGAPSPTQKRRHDLIEQLNEIRKKQAGGKSARTSKQEQVKRLDEQLRSRIAEQKAARGKVSFKSVEDLDGHIKQLEAQVDTGKMRLVDEKKALAEVSNLKKVRKNFVQFDSQEKQIAELRASIKTIKDSMEDPEAKAWRAQYDTLQAELDTIKAEQDEAYKNLSSLRDERSKLHSEQREKFDAIRKIKDEYYGQKKAFAAWEREVRQKAWERKQAERDRIERERKKERAQRMLDEASDPAFLDEIRRARSLLHFFDPTAHAAAPPTPTTPTTPSLSAQSTRKVDDAGLKGTKLVRKEDRDDDYLAPATKKSGKKGGKKDPAAASSKGFNVPPSVIEDCAAMGLDPPGSQADVPVVIEKIKAKLTQWENDQETQTKRNVDKAKKEIEKLEKEEAQEAAGSSNDASDKKAGEDKGVAEVTAELKETSVEEKKEEAEETKA